MLSVFSSAVSRVSVQLRSGPVPLNRRVASADFLCRSDGKQISSLCPSRVSGRSPRSAAVACVPCTFPRAASRAGWSRPCLSGFPGVAASGAARRLVPVSYCAPMSSADLPVVGGLVTLSGVAASALAAACSSVAVSQRVAVFRLAVRHFVGNATAPTHRSRGRAAMKLRRAPQLKRWGSSC